jgi:hypothetical protein
MFVMQKLIACIFIFALLIAAPAARAGIYEELAAPADKVELESAATEQTQSAAPTLSERIVTPPAKKMILDERYEPIVLLRTIYVSTFEDTIEEKDSQGGVLELNSFDMDPSIYGHREGFVIENVELGMKGRFNDSGIYYQSKFELVPREKNGSISSDYLKDAYVGWSKYTVFSAQAGRMKIPFSQANLVSTADQALIYKPTLDVLSPKRQLGVQASVSDPWQIVRVSGGAFNSVQLAIQQLKKTDQLMYVGRGELNVDNILGTAGASFLDFELRLGSSIAHTKENFDPSTEHRWMGADGRFHLWRFTVEGEYLLKNFYTPPDLEGKMELQHGKGWHADLTVMAWPKVIDVTGRIEQIDGDEVERGFSSTLSIDELSLQKKRWITGGLTFHITDQALLEFNYVHRQELEGFSFGNDVLLGMAQFDL